MSFLDKKRRPKVKHKFTSDVIKFNKLGGVPKGHPFIDREFPGAFKVLEGPVETSGDLIESMNKEEMIEYLEREWNRGKNQAGEN